MLFNCVFQVCSCVVLISKDKSNNNIINQLFFLKLIHLNVCYFDSPSKYTTKLQEFALQLIMACLYIFIRGGPV